MNTSAITTILGTVALGLMKKNSGSHNDYKAMLKKHLSQQYDLFSSTEKKVSKPRRIDDIFNMSIDEKSSITELDLSLMKLESLPNNIFDGFNNLRKLNLLSNNLTSLPKEIGYLTNLEVLNLENNNLTSLPKEIGYLKNLEVLNLDGNKLTALPKEIGDLSNLINLNLGDNNFTSLSKEIGNLSNLERLSLYGNKIEMPSPRVLQFWTKNLNPNIFKNIMENIVPYSQLRRF